MRRGRCWAKKAKSHERQLEPAPDLWRLSPRGSGGTETSGVNESLLGEGERSMGQRYRGGEQACSYMGGRVSKHWVKS